MGFVHDINSYRAEVQLIRENCLSTRFGAGAITSSLRVALVYMILLQLLPQVRGEDTSLEFFETKIRPALVTYCYECHSTKAKRVGGELLLDSREGVQKGGETGAVLIAGQPEDSLLLRAIRYTDDVVKMPPKGKLPESVIADFELWVKSGATDPRDQPSRTKAAVSWEETMRERSHWWSLKPVQKPTIPANTSGELPTDPVDRFIVTRMSKEGLTPATVTDPRTLIRRLSLVLTGLPPTPEQTELFVAECQQEVSSTAIPRAVVERLVDTLLESPHFGEQWARHWMDVVRFSETHGNEWNYEVHHAWRYRDYLIRAFNRDVPYDQLIREHIAGDLLPNPRWNERDEFNESIIGTGFYRFGEVNHDDCISLRSIGYDLADNQIDTLTKAFQATTVACARCHNHKLDAISTEDYYSMLAIVRSSRNASHCIDAPTVNSASKQRLRQLKTELRDSLSKLWIEDARQFRRYMLAAQAASAQRSDANLLAAGLDSQRLAKWVAVLKADKLPFEDLFEPWRRLSFVETPAANDAPADALFVSSSVPQIFRELAQQFSKEDRERSESNQSQYVLYADFRENNPTNWQVGGQAMYDPPSRSGDFSLHVDGDLIVQSILPAGRFTHSLSAKQNGTLRSPVLPLGRKYISFQVLGQRSSAVRLVSNNCQLNYANYRALTSPTLQWVTFSPPDDRDSLRTYAELMTMFDNPKFPDQLAALGGDSANYKLPWDKAAENPRSYFGVTHVVLHDIPEPPKQSVSHLRPILTGEPASLEMLTSRYVSQFTTAIQAWSEDLASDDDTRVLDTLLKHELLCNQLVQSPLCTELMQQYRLTEAELSIPRVIAGVSDGGPGLDQPVFLRGDCSRPAESVPRRYLQVLSNSRSPFSATGSGRLELANQIANEQNPLTTRVIVNRIWHHLFGIGIVRTVDDFGHVGELPSHPELLDYLAHQFMEQGWSVKRMIRSLVLTGTFQQASYPSGLSRELDPQNRLLQHYPARRLEAESVRDAILAASGRLDRALYGQSIQPFREKEYADRRLFPGPLDGFGRRSIYVKNNLMEAPKFLGAFNLPGGKVAQGRRDVTNVPAQALALLNDPFVLQQAETWSQRVVTQSADTLSSRLDNMFQSATTRPPTAAEHDRFEAAVRTFARFYQIPDADVMTSPLVWKDVAHTLFNLNETIYIP